MLLLLLLLVKTLLRVNSLLGKQVLHGRLNISGNLLCQLLDKLVVVELVEFLALEIRELLRLLLLLLLHLFLLKLLLLLLLLNLRLLLQKLLLVK
jgi:hypothetical protein